jgi:hypothetical protein
LVCRELGTQFDRAAHPAGQIGDLEVQAHGDDRVTFGHRLEQARLGIESEPQLSVWSVALFERFDQSGQSAAWTASSWLIAGRFGAAAPRRRVAASRQLYVGKAAMRP